jgi:hypothetical protein
MGKGEKDENTRAARSSLEHGYLAAEDDIESKLSVGSPKVTFRAIRDLTSIDKSSSKLNINSRVVRSQHSGAPPSPRPTSQIAELPLS